MESTASPASLLKVAFDLDPSENPCTDPVTIALVGKILRIILLLSAAYKVSTSELYTNAVGEKFDAIVVTLPAVICLTLELKLSAT